MGTILVKKYDFSSLQGILDAYKSAFPKSDAIISQFNDSNLKELAAKRNLVAHRAGLIDEEYCRIMGIDPKEFGARLEINNDDVKRLGDFVIETAKILINTVLEYNNLTLE
jgi:hypothetical protein